MSGFYVQITWTEPFTNYMPITSYTVLLKSVAGTYAAYPLLCDGSSSFSMANHYCYLQMQELRIAPISLTQGSLIQAKIIATNFNGSSAASAENTAGTTI